MINNMINSLSHKADVVYLCFHLIFVYSIIYFFTYLNWDYLFEYINKKNNHSIIWVFFTHFSQNNKVCNYFQRTLSPKANR